MSCDTFLDRVDALLEGDLARPDREEALRHLLECAECRGLFAALAEPADDPRLSEGILARTSGSGCVSARARLCAWVDRELDEVDSELVAGHLRRCAECEGLARTLETMREALPRLAAIDPGPGFCESVLAHTSRRPRPAPVGARLAGFFTRLLDRPRVAWEAAFVATVIFVSPVMIPRFPLADLPSRGLDLLRNPAPERRMAMATLRGKANDLEAKLLGGAREAWATIGAVVVDDSAAAASAVARRSAGRWETIRRRYGTISGVDASVRKGGGAGTIERQAETAREKPR